jgi:hypothetical protein
MIADTFYLCLLLVLLVVVPLGLSVLEAEYEDSA